MSPSKKHLRRSVVACCAVLANGNEYYQDDWQRVSEREGQALSLYATAFHRDTPDEMGGITYDKSTGLWRGINELSDLTSFRTNWRVVGKAGESLDDEGDEGIGTVDLVGRHRVPGEVLKGEGIETVPYTCGGADDMAMPFGEDAIPDPEYWIVSETNSKTKNTNSYFSKRYGNPDLNTFIPSSFRDSRFVRVSSTGELLEEIPLPPWLYWDGVFDWDPAKCHGTRVYKGLHDLAVLEAPSRNPWDDGDDAAPAQLVMINQIALYQDGGEPTIFEGSHLRIMFWDARPERASPDPGGGCHTAVTYSRSYRYLTSRLHIETLQKGARHVHAVFGLLALSPTELLVAETEFLEGFGINEYVSEVFYVRFASADDTVDHCDSLMDCDVPLPEKRKLITRRHTMELSSLSWGPHVEVDGVQQRTVAMSFENDQYVGILMELYTFNETALELAPLWEDGLDSATFVRQRTWVLVAACVIFSLGIFCQRWWIRRQIKRSEQEQRRKENRRNNLLRTRGGHIEGRIETPQLVVDLEVEVEEEEEPPSKLGYKEYVLASAVTNSFLLGGVVFGFPGMVLILRREGIHAEVCSCGVFCAGQQEQLSIISTMGFAAAIGSRLFSGIFLDKFGPKITAVLSGIVSFSGLILLAAARDVAALTDRIATAWIILAVGGSSMHLTSFHVTNLQAFPADKRRASLFVSAGFGAGSLVLPVLQVINQYGDVGLPVIAAFYSVVALLLTANSFFVQPWRAWNTLGSEAELDLNCFRRKWWPTNFLALHAIRKPASKKFPTLEKALKSFTFWGECYWFSCQLFLLTYYLSTINQILFALGDATVNQNVDSLLNNMFTRAGVFFNGLGWLWSPIVGYLMATKSIYVRVYLEIAMALVMALMLTIPVIEVQVLVFLLQALVRLQLFSNHFAYIGERFGFRHFGLLNGISSLVAGLFGLLGYLLQIYSLFVFNGNFAISYFFIAGLVVSSCIFPFFLRKQDEAVRETESETVAADDEKIENEEQDQDSESDLDVSIDSSFEAFLRFCSSPDDSPDERAPDPTCRRAMFRQAGRQSGQRNVYKPVTIWNQSTWYI